MKQADFDVVLEKVLDNCRRVLGSKAGEYANDGDRLHNFKRSAHLQGCSQEAALGGMLVKHIVSVFDMIDAADKGVSHPEAVWDEKIGDAINYLILLKAITVEASEFAEFDLNESRHLMEIPPHLRDKEVTP